jgi:hypothetical protein
MNTMMNIVIVIVVIVIIMNVGHVLLHDGRDDFNIIIIIILYSKYV